MKKNKKVNNDDIFILAPVSGKVKDLSSIKDDVFSERMIGDGVAITPSENEIFSPVNGIVKTVFPTGHAYGITTKQGPGVLIHVGVDTAELNGEGFNKLVSQEKKAKIKTKLVEVDFDYLSKKEKSSDTMILITNETIGDYKITDIAKGKIKRGEVLFKLTK